MGIAAAYGQAPIRLQQLQRRLGYRNEVVVFEHILVDAELAGAAKVDSDVRPDDACHFADAVVRRHRTVVHEFALLKLPLTTGTPMKCRYGR